MSRKTTVITYITSRVSYEVASSVQDKLKKDFPIEFYRVEDFATLYKLLGDPEYHTDFISVDLDDAYRLSETSVFELINSLATMIKITNRPTRILLIVGHDTPPNLIKEIISFPAVAGFTLRTGGDIGYEDHKIVIQNFLDNNFEIPKKVQDIMNPKRKSISDDKEISLTPRQQQIFRMVTDRGASNKVIAKMLNISESTVKLHMSCILKKFKVKNRTQLAVFSRQQDPTNKAQSMPK